MKNLELQNYLKQFDDETPIKHLDQSHKILGDIRDFKFENILHTSETAYVDGGAPEDEWDCEEGKLCLGDGKQFLLLNPIIV